MLALGQLTFRDAQKARLVIGEPPRWMETARGLPFYAVDIPYMGAIAYATGEYDDAMKWFDRFLRWESVSGRPLTRESSGCPVEAILPELRFCSN